MRALTKGLLLAVSLAVPTASHAAILLAEGSLSSLIVRDLSGRADTLENGQSQSILGGLGSGLAFAGGNRFYALPDRGPNALAYNPAVDNTVSYISRFQTVGLNLTPTGGAIPFQVQVGLQGTTLLYSSQALNYGTGAGLGVPAGDAINTLPGQYYFTGRSDNFGSTYGTGTGSANQFNARYDPESIRVSNDGSKVYISDEYGPYVYEFDTATGERTHAYTLPANLYVANQDPIGKNEEKGETPGNTSGRTDNKGMEGLAITPDGKTLVGIMQAPTVQDKKSSKLVRIVTIDIASGETHEYAYTLTSGSGVSEIVALNSHQFLVDERDGAGLGGDPGAGIKDFYVIDLAGAVDITTKNAADSLAVSVAKSKIVDFAALLAANGLPVPSKIEGLSFGNDTVYNGTLYHTLFVSNDNDFTPGNSGQNEFYVVGLSDAELAQYGVTYMRQALAAVPEPSTWAMLLLGFGAIGGAMRASRRRTTLNYA